MRGRDGELMERGMETEDRKGREGESRRKGERDNKKREGNIWEDPGYDRCEGRQGAVGGWGGSKSCRGSPGGHMLQRNQRHHGVSKIGRASRRERV